ncbi:hypothetical protein [uncultured Algimonas sp.]|uniref:hypothetical protein n=1 Tax=uncultured Algimonas sp. TaxID=1547920 RepID=UPI002619EF5B|nr:hypothetical protein [uncultured Algimonas sp.]
MTASAPVDPLRHPLVVTMNHPRHQYLLSRLAERCDSVTVLQEVTTLFPGAQRGFIRKSDVMKTYFARVRAAEREVFGQPGLQSSGLRTLPMAFGDMNHLNASLADDLAHCDCAVVFGGGFIKGWLAEHLIGLNAVNIHMGVSPYYRGSSCNFWAAYDGRFDMIGATLHRLSDKLDGGEILRIVRPDFQSGDYFTVGMEAARAAVDGVVDLIETGDILNKSGKPQDASLELRYSLNKEFTDEIATAFLDNVPTAEAMRASMDSAAGAVP